MAGILEECGKFSVDLQEISNSIYGNKIKNGEKLKKEDIDREVFMSYQKILSIAQDSNTIHKAIIDLGIAVSNGNFEVNKIATKLAIDAVNLKIEQEERERNDNGVEATIISAGAITGIGNEIKDFTEAPKRHEYTVGEYEAVRKGAQILEKIVGKQKLSDLIQEANGGNEEIASKVVLYQNAQIYIAMTDGLEEIPENVLPKYMQYMLLLGKNKDIEENMKLYEKMAEKLPEDVFVEDTSGKKVVDDKKVMNLYEILCNGKESDIESLEETLSEVGKEYANNKENQFDSVEALTEESVIEGHNQMIDTLYNDIEDRFNLPNKTEEEYEALKQKANKLVELAKQDPDAILRLAESVSSYENRRESKSFEIVIAAALDSLIKAKREGTFVEDEYTAEQTRNLFKNLGEHIVENDFVLANNIYFFGKLVEISPDDSKGMLDYFVSQQDKNPKVVGYIHDLGKKYAEYKKKIINENEKAGKENETKKQINDDGEEPEGP